MKYAANIISLLRLLLSPSLLFVEPFSGAFYLIYILCGLSDMADGYIARRTGSVSKTGSGLDSAGDLVLVSVCLIKLLPVMDLRAWVFVCAALIAAIRLVSIIVCLKAAIPLPHTWADKAAGLSLFILPLILGFADVNICAIPVCGIAAFAAIHEATIIKKSKTDV